MKEVKDYQINKNTSITGLLDNWKETGGFTAQKLATSADILKEMTQDKNCYNFLSFPSCLIATGARGVIHQLVKQKKFDCIMTTAGTIAHDITRTFDKYYHGDFLLDDEETYKKGYSRLGNVLVPLSVYGEQLEKKVTQMLEEIHAEGHKEISTHELSWQIGKRLPEQSILHQAWKNKIPVIIPGITDGAVGTHIFMFSQDHDFKINVLKDEKLLSDIVFDHKKTGALMIGGGISKHHVIWWNQYKDGLDYAVYLTSAPEWDGSLSGARMREAVSWGKLKAKARYVTVEGDATINLPLAASRIL